MKRSKYINRFSFIRVGPAHTRTTCHSSVTSCVHRKQAAMWLLGDSQRSQGTKLEERAVSHIITRMDDLTLTPTHNTTSSAHNSSMCRSPSSDRLTEVTHVHTYSNIHTVVSVCHLSVIS